MYLRLWEENANNLHHGLGYSLWGAGLPLWSRHLCWCVLFHNKVSVPCFDKNSLKRWGFGYRYRNSQYRKWISMQVFDMFTFFGSFVCKSFFFFFESREDKNRVEREMKGGGGLVLKELGRERREEIIYIYVEREREMKGREAIDSDS